MKNLLTFLLVMFSSIMFSQTNVLHLNYYNVNPIPCPNDSTLSFYKYDNWSFYQTTDDTWSGDHYTESCPNLTTFTERNGSIRYVLDLSSIDASKPVFLAYDGPDVDLLKNSIYNIYAALGPDKDAPIKFGDECPEGMCSGVFVISEHSDPMYADSLSCQTLYPFTESDYFNISSCFTGEKTEHNKITDLVFKVSIDEPSDATIFTYRVIFEPNESLAISDPQIAVPERLYNGTSYNAVLNDLFQDFFGNYLITHHTPGLPSETNQSFTELVPELPKSNPTTININIEWEGISFQKYTQLIGALVEGSDTERHPVNLEITTDLCLQYIDLIGTSGTSFKMNGGTIEFSDMKACLQVRDNSSIIIEPGQQVYLGRDGVGNVNLRSGGNVVIKKDAELIFGGHLILTPYDAYEGEATIHVDLQGGGHLEFTKDARIENNLFGNELFLYVYMNGGTVDLSQLSPTDRDKIILVYDEAENSLTDITLFPNPTQDFLNIYNTDQQHIQNIDIYNVQGQKVYSKKVDTENPTLKLDLTQLDTGMHTIRIKHSDDILSYKIVIE